MEEKKAKALLTVFQQNWLHIRHIENERMIWLHVYIAIMSAVFYAVATKESMWRFLPFIVVFLFMFSVLSFLVAVKMEAVIDDYISKNARIVKSIGVEKYAGLRVRSGIWRFVRLRYLFPSFYCVATLALLILLTYIVTTDIHNISANENITSY